VVALAMEAVVTGVQAVPAGAEATARYIVVYRDPVDGDGITSLLERVESFHSTFRYHSALNGFAAELTAAQVLRISANPDVAFISQDRIVHADAVVGMKPGDTAPTGVQRIEAATAATANEPSTVTVAVIDTGSTSVIPTSTPCRARTA